MAGGMLLAAALAAGWPVAVTADAQVDLGGREIRVCDVVDLAAVPAGERARLGSKVIARMPPGRSSIKLSRQALASLVRRTVPALRPEAGSGEITFTLPPPPPAPPAAPSAARAEIAPPPAVEAGAKLTLVSRSGPVLLEREVTALQSARAGGRVFVRDGDGQVLAVTLAEDVQ